MNANELARILREMARDRYTPESIERATDRHIILANLAERRPRDARGRFFMDFYHEGELAGAAWAAAENGSDRLQRLQSFLCEVEREPERRIHFYYRPGARDWGSAAVEIYGAVEPRYFHRFGLMNVTPVAKQLFAGTIYPVPVYGFCEAACMRPDGSSLLDDVWREPWADEWCERFANEIRATNVERCNVHRESNILE